ncbi:MAG: alpha-isopropylmalate synthase regulatory domain-containing protein [Nanoarchaeota archaeon]
MTRLELYDCTLREGEQAAGASFNLDSRLKVFSMLDDFGFDYIELGWPHASKEIFESFAACKKIRKHAKIVAFGSTSIRADPKLDENLNSLVNSHADYACIFGKSHLEHVEKQLKITPEENIKRIRESIRFLIDNGMPVFYDAEHFFDAFKDNKEYALMTVKTALGAGAERIILCDTNGAIMPTEAEKIVRETKQYLGEKALIGVHFHNDRGLALANAIASLDDVIQMQGTINGIGERVGNLDFTQLLPVLNLSYSDKIKPSLLMEKLKILSQEVYLASGIEVPVNSPFVGEYAFAHKGGVHIDATNKGASYEHSSPELFGNQRKIILNTLGGASCVTSVAAQFGYVLDKKDQEVQKKIKLLFDELKNMEQKGYRIGGIDAEQYLLISKYFGNIRRFFEIESYKINSERLKDKETSKFFMIGSVDEKPVNEEFSVEGGPIDAAYKAFVDILSAKYPLIKKLRIADFHISIAKRKAEESTVRTEIYFEDESGMKSKTVGVDGNMFQSSLEALEKGFRYYLNKRYNSNNKLINKQGDSEI